MNVTSFPTYLHWSFDSERVLLPFIALESFGGFLLACLLSVLICLLERILTATIDKQWEPRSLRLTRRRLALWRTSMFGMVTFLRLCYMLIAMSFHLGLLIVIVFTLSTAQFFIELSNLPKPPPPSARIYESNQPLLPQSRQQPFFKTRPRSKSKPDGIFIHPAESNIARADAVALELGIGGETERVKGHTISTEDPSWEVGKGRDMAREMLVGQMKVPHQPLPPSEPFYVGDDSDSD